MPGFGGGAVDLARFGGAVLRSGGVPGAEIRHLEKK